MARDLEHEQAIREVRRGGKPWWPAPAWSYPKPGGIASRALQLAKRNAWDKRKSGQWERR